MLAEVKKSLGVHLHAFISKIAPKGLLLVEMYVNPYKIAPKGLIVRDLLVKPLVKHNLPTNAHNYAPKGHLCAEVGKCA